MSEDVKLVEVSGRAKKLRPEEESHVRPIPPLEPSAPPEVAVGPDDPELVHFLVRWDSPRKDGEKPKWFPVFARNLYEAARFFAMSCDVGNPRPPVTRRAVVRDVMTPNPGETLVVVETKPTLTYTAGII